MSEAFEAAAADLAGKISRSVERSIAGANVVAVAFSGGLDSSILAACARRSSRVVACTGCSARSGDEAKARAAAEELGIGFILTQLTPEVVSRELAGIELPFEPSLMDRSLWCLYSSVARSAAASGAGVILLGQLADELFGGYAKYSRALERVGPEAATEMMRADLAEYGGRGRIRDVRACARWVTPRFPFEDAEVVGAASAIPLAYKLAAGGRKLVLRRAATLLGVPEGLAGSDKKAAQYSSGIQRLVASSHF